MQGKKARETHPYLLVAAKKLSSTSSTHSKAMKLEYQGKGQNKANEELTDSSTDTRVQDVPRGFCGCTDIWKRHNGHCGREERGQSDGYCPESVRSYRDDTMPTMGTIPSVMIPRVPSAPMKSLVVSNPAEDFLDLRRVFMTSPEGNTTVCNVI